MLRNTTNSKTGLLDLADTLLERRKNSHGRLRTLSDDSISRIKHACLDDNKPIEMAIGRGTLESMRSRLLDQLTSDTELDEKLHGGAETAFLRQVAPPLHVTLPAPHLQIRPTASVIFAAVGAVAGMMLGGPLVRLLFGYPAESGVLVGGPLGAGLAMVALQQLAYRDKVRRGLLVALGIGAAADTLLSVCDQLNPLRRIRGRLFGKERPIKSWWKRILVYVILFTLLMLARPKRQVRVQDGLLVCRTAIDAWLGNVFDLIVLLPVDREKEPATTQSDTDPPIVVAIAKLRTELKSAAPTPNPDAVVDAAAAVVSAFETAGYEEVCPDGELVWDQKHETRFDKFGVLEPGMPIRVLKHAIIRDGALIGRGVVARAGTEHNKKEPN